MCVCALKFASHRDDYTFRVAFVEMKLMAHIYPYMLWVMIVVSLEHKHRKKPIRLVAVMIIAFIFYFFF